MSNVATASHHRQNKRSCDIRKHVNSVHAVSLPVITITSPIYPDSSRSINFFSFLLFLTNEFTDDRNTVDEHLIVDAITRNQVATTRILTACNAPLRSARRHAAHWFSAARNKQERLALWMYAAALLWVTHARSPRGWINERFYSHQSRITLGSDGLVIAPFRNGNKFNVYSSGQGNSLVSFGFLEKFRKGEES